MRFFDISRSLLFSCAVAGLAGCADSATAPTAAADQPAPSLAFTENDIKIPYQQPVIVPCGRLGQEIVPFSGTIHVLFQMSFSGSGRRHLKMQTNAQGMTGIGLVSGDLYRLNGGSSDAYEFDVDGTYANTFVNNFHVESAGATGNIVAHETLRVLVNANGIPTVQTVNFTAECRNFAS